METHIVSNVDLSALLGSGSVHFIQVENSGGLNAVSFDHIVVITFMTKAKVSTNYADEQHICLIPACI